MLRYCRQDGLTSLTYVGRSDTAACDYPAADMMQMGVDSESAMEMREVYRKKMESKEKRWQRKKKNQIIPS